MPLLSYMLFSLKKISKVPAPIVYYSIVVKKKMPMLETNYTTLPFSYVKVSFIYPEEFGSKEDLARLQQIFIGTFFQNLQLDSLAPQAAVEAYLSGYMEEYRSLARATTKRRRDLPEMRRVVLVLHVQYQQSGVSERPAPELRGGIQRYTGGRTGRTRLYQYRSRKLITHFGGGYLSSDYEKSLGSHHQPVDDAVQCH